MVDKKIRHLPRDNYTSPKEKKKQKQKILQSEILAFNNYSHIPEKCIDKAHFFSKYGQ